MTYECKCKATDFECSITFLLVNLDDQKQLETVFATVLF